MRRTTGLGLLLRSLLPGDHLGRDVRFALRLLGRQPGFALLGVTIMALGIGANTAVFSVVYSVLLKPLPYAAADRIVTLANASTKPGERGTQGPLGRQVSAPNFQDWHDQNTSFDAMALYSSRRTSVMTGTAAEYAAVTTATPEFFRVFGISPAAGRPFAREEEQPGGSGAVILSATYAQQHFGGMTPAVGQTIRLYDRTVSIVGVMPPGFDFPDQTDLWYPALTRVNISTQRRTANNFRAVGLVKPTVTLAQAQADMTAIATRLEQQYPEGNADRGVALTRLQDDIVGHARLMLYLLLGAVGLVLLIACANMATLLLAKATQRTQEIAVRAALGASRARIIQQLLVEGLVQACFAGIAGIVVAIWATRAIVALAPGDVPRLAETAIDWHVLAFTCGISLLVSVLFGLPPALHAARVNVGDPLKGGATRSILGGRAGRLREGLVIAEIALTLVLLAGGGLLIKSLIALQHAPLGFDPEHVLIMEATAPALGDQAKRANAFFDAILPDIATLPGVEAVGATMGPPGRVDADSGYFIDYMPKMKEIHGAKPAVMSIVAPGTFAALGIPIAHGRDFRASDTWQAPAAAIINESLARQAFAGQDPIGRTIFCLFDSMKPMTIIGVVGDVRQYGPERPPTAECYMPYTQHYYNNATLNILVRTTIDPGAMATSMRRIVRAHAADVSIRFTSMDAVIDEHVATPRFRALLLGLFGAIALCLALAGVYGVMAFIVSQRANEMGLRMALGAAPGDVLRLLFGRGARLAAIGLAVGVACAIATTRLIGGLLFEVQPYDATTYFIAIALLGATTMLAIYVPARRSMKIDPLTALRQE
jgi:putative ABC transport system permease protein